MAADRLSDLPDDLLIRILSFVPAKEAATTTVLSRRWRRPLWLETGDVNHDSRSYTTGTGSLFLRWLAMGDTDHVLAFHHPHGRVRSKITIVARDHSICIDEAGVEELRLDCLDGCRRYTFAGRLEKYDLSLHSLPLAALRVLHLTGSNLISSLQQEHVAFPCLEALRLRRCTTELEQLQDIILAAPKLADLRLESLRMRFQDRSPVYRLHCPAVTFLAMTNCNMDTRYIKGCSFELDAPCLRRFRCNQIVCFDTFSLESPAPDLERVDLAIRSGAAPLRSMLRAMCHTRVLKLTVFSIADIDDGRFGPLPVFPNLEHLAIEELCGCLNNHGAAITAMVNLLRSCPVIRELRVKFSWRKYLSEISDPCDQMAYLDFAACKSFNGDGDDDGGDCCEVVLDLHELYRNRKLDCLQNSLRRVAVQFDVDKLTCFQVQLVKFLVQNARVLEEVDIDGGSQYDSSYIDGKVAGWRASSRDKEKRLRYCMSMSSLRCRSRSSFGAPPPLSSFPPLGYSSSLQLAASPTTTDWVEVQSRRRRRSRKPRS